MRRLGVASTCPDVVAVGAADDRTFASHMPGVRREEVSRVAPVPMHLLVSTDVDRHVMTITLIVCDLLHTLRRQPMQSRWATQHHTR